jgi:hypothetical protein
MIVICLALVAAGVTFAMALVSVVVGTVDR